MVSDIAAADWLHLTDGEEILWEGHPTLYTISSDILFSLILIIIGIGFTVVFMLPLAWVPEPLTRQWAWLPLIFVVAGIIFIGIRYGLLRRTQYVITTEEGTGKKG